MQNLNERAIIQKEIALLKTKRIDDQKMIQLALVKLLDQLNPIKKIQASILHTIDQSLDHAINRLYFIKPIFFKMKKLFINSK
jgi:hypothetical protein